MNDGHTVVAPVDDPQLVRRSWVESQIARGVERRVFVGDNRTLQTRSKPIADDRERSRAALGTPLRIGYSRL
jgi:hypothetical protein